MTALAPVITISFSNTIICATSLLWWQQNPDAIILCTMPGFTRENKLRWTRASQFNWHGPLGLPVVLRDRTEGVEAHSNWIGHVSLYESGGETEISRQGWKDETKDLWQTHMLQKTKHIFSIKNLFANVCLSKFVLFIYYFCLMNNKQLSLVLIVCGLLMRANALIIKFAVHFHARDSCLSSLVQLYGTFNNLIKYVKDIFHFNINRIDNNAKEISYLEWNVKPKESEIFVCKIDYLV